MLNYRKKSHMFGVAELMIDRADIWGLNPDAMYITGLLHDIGDIHVITGHEQIGAEMIRTFIEDTDALYAIAHHGDDVDRLIADGQPVPNELLALMEADLSVDRYGWCAGFEPRLKDLQKRYTSTVIAEDNIRYLENLYKEKGIEPPKQNHHEY